MGLKKTVLITGVSRGIGYATTMYFLNKKYNVIGTSKNPDLIKINHPNFYLYQCNFLNKESIKKCIKDIDTFKIDILINNAAILLESNDNITIDIEKLRQTFEVNVFGLIDFCEGVIPYLNTSSQIINMNSAWGAFSEENSTECHPHYKLSKAALNMYTKTLAKRLKKTNICVSSFNPGWVKTNMGGNDAKKTPLDAAKDLFQFTLMSRVESGSFWQSGKHRSQRAKKRTW